MPDEPSAAEGGNAHPAAAVAKRSWWIDKHHVLHCFSSPAGDCRVTSLVDLPEVSGFYDPVLDRGTHQINGIFAALAGRKRAGLEPAVIVVDGRPLLAWTQPSTAGPDADGAIGPDDDPDAIRQALRLKPAKGAAGHKRSWIMVDHKVWCYASPAGDCVVSRFWESVEAAGSFYDADLERATREANTILDELREAKGRRSELSFILVENALLLVWTQPGVGPDSDPHVIRQALGLTD
jgi:hypothetical protein